ncbi:MAG: MFS transporter [Phenylobacterium sp.]|nr:MFS transporter [Phenylobacterium sp.]MBP8245671.1 MFS transporter [Phenylobacterium sp.]
MNGSKPRDVFRLPGYLAFWSAETVSEFGTYITTLSLQVLVVVTLSGSATDVGLLNAARWLPYLVFGLVMGALVDRWRRKPLLVGTDLGRALLLGAIPAFWWLGWLSLPMLMVFVALFGVLTLLNDAASQSFVPRIVPAPFLLAANARLDQGAAVAQTSGPVIAGALVTTLGAPLAVLADAASYLFSAVVVSRIAVQEPRRDIAAHSLNLRREIGAGLAYVYRHPMLAPFAISTHAWFLFNSMLVTVFVPFLLLELKLSAFQLGIALAAAGVTGLLGSLLAAHIGRAWGAGGAVIACRALMPAAWAVIAIAPATGRWTLVALAVGQGLYGLAMGASNANEMAYRQAVTPDALQARMNTTMRSLNRAMIVVGAPAGGWLADSIGYRPTLWIAIAGFIAVTIFLAASPYRGARHGDG